MTFFIKKILFPILIFIFVFILVLHFINYYTNKNSNTDYTIKAYKNTVALYNGDEIIKIYGDIVLNTLPKTDIQNFEIGIPIASQKDADYYLTDFDN